MLAVVCKDDDTRDNIREFLEEKGEEVLSFSSLDDTIPWAEAEKVIILSKSMEEVKDHNLVKGVKILCYTWDDIGNYEGKPEIEPIGKILACSILGKIEKYRDREKSEILLDVLKICKDGLSIFVHNNPDPDALASAMALELLCDHVDIPSTTYYSGEIGHPENELFIGHTGLHLERVTEDDVVEKLSGMDHIAFVDFARPGENNIIPDDIEATIIIDHHYTNLSVEKGGYVEIKSVGATSTIMIKHLRTLDIEIPTILASALLYGIKVDTMDYTRNIVSPDFEAISYLLPLADKELLEIFEAIPMRPNTVDALGRAIMNREIKDGIMTTNTGYVTQRDDIPQVADILEGERDISTVLVSGMLKDNIHISVRSKDPKLNMGDIMKRAFKDLGSAGGHLHSAGGKISVNVFDSEEEGLKEIAARFRDEVKRT